MDRTKVMVTRLPKNGKECPFGEYIGMTSKYKCMFQQGTLSRCNLDCDMECGYLFAPFHFEDYPEEENAK